MFYILREPDQVDILSHSLIKDAKVRFALENNTLSVYLQAQEEKPEFIVLRWKHEITEPTRVMGDKWERTYGDAKWSSLNVDEFMPWYFMANSGDETVGCGVMVQPNSFVCFQCDASGVTAWFDVRCGAVGVELNGRELLAGVIVCEQYKDISTFEAAKRFCSLMCPKPILPKEPVYGSNNWYYAYGKSSYEEIMSDTDVIVELAGENGNKPFMVIDDGWSVNSCAGPWTPNGKYGNMKRVAEGLHKKGVKAGLWFRPLHDLVVEENHTQWLIQRDKKNYLDPSHPEVQQYLRDTMRAFKGWGFELVKYDFSTVDMFGQYGFTLNGEITRLKDWSFYDRSKTSAEIVLDFYRLLREEAGDMILIGCNTVSHLCAGLVEVNRIGDDTSGRTWQRTRAMGVNTLAFRLCQNKTFYAVDADCVGILEDKIPWALNRQWLDLVARSGSPLFVSGQPSALTQEMKSDLKKAFAINAKQEDMAEPLDWEYNNAPQLWKINGETQKYDFVMDVYPTLSGKWE